MLATLEMGLQWNALHSTYVEHSQTQDSILGYIIGLGEENFPSKRRNLNILGQTIVPINGMLSELTNVRICVYFWNSHVLTWRKIWRCWELYAHNWLVVIPPLLGVLAGLSRLFLFTLEIRH